AYLNAEERRAATVLYRALDAARREMTAGVRDALRLQAVMRKVLDSELLARADYAEIVDANTFEPVIQVRRSCYALLAVFIGKTRLIDNLLIERTGADSDELLFHM